MKKNNINYRPGFINFRLMKGAQLLAFCFLLLFTSHMTGRAGFTDSERIDVLSPAEKQQGILISGRVTGEDGEPLTGVNIIEKGTTNGTVTDASGNFKLTVSSEESVISYSYVGYVSEEIPSGTQTVFSITLIPDLAALEEVIVIGYGTVKKKDLTGAVGVISSDEMNTEGANTVIKALQGKMAGVTVESSGGWPGARNRVLIRGISTVNNATDPLYVVDGVPIDNIDKLMPSDIESISVLKDASAAAIYGTRASNGVILVTTRQGKKGENKIEFKTTFGWQQLANRLEVLGSEDWATVVKAAYENDGRTGVLPIADSLPRDENGNIISTDWQDYIYQTAPIQNYELSASGGGDFFNYSVSGGYFGQEGIVKLTDYDRLNLRLRSEYKRKRITVGETVILANERFRDMPDGWGGQGGNPVSSALKMIPAYEVYNDTALGGFEGATGNVPNVANPVGQLYLQDPVDEYNNVFLNLYAELELLRGLTYKYNIGYRKTFRYSSTFNEPYRIGTQFNNPYYSLSETRAQTDNFLQEHTLNYSRELGKFAVNALAGFTFEKNHYRETYAAGTNLPQGLSVLDAITLDPTVGGYENRYAIVSYLGRVVTSYDDRYLLTVSMRRDGTSRFGEANRFGNFPSVAVGWNVSNEKFFGAMSGIINNLKLRASYGAVGNDQVGEYRYATGITVNENYNWGQTPELVIGAIQKEFAAKDIKWESATTKNIGFDLGFLQHKISVIADYFVKKNYDILLQVPIPISTGASNTPYVNAGELTNKGIELAVTYKNNSGDLFYSFTGTFTHVSNMMDKMGVGTQEIYSGQPTHHGDYTCLTKEGEEVASFYLIQTDGIFDTEEELNSHVYVDSTGQTVLDDDGYPILIQPRAQVGDVKFIDADLDGSISDADRVIVGSPTPKFEYSFNASLEWKGIDFTFYFQGTYGNKIYNGLRQDLEDTRLGWNYSTDVSDFWTPENHSDIPRPTLQDRNGNNRISDRYLEDGSYLRIRTLQLGYTFPEKITNIINIDKIRIYGSVDNLWTFTKYSGMNPDLGRNERNWRAGILNRGVDYGHISYPLPRTWIIGLQVSL